MMEKILSFFIAPAYAEATQAQANQGSFVSMAMMFGFIFLFAYFVIWRPQSKRAKDQQNLLGSLAKGDEVMTTSGVLGRITKISDQYITLAIANNVDIVIQKSAIASLLPKGTLKSVE